ncbi:MAG: DUF4097 family beta strand repeat-containing protein [Terriglobales bacterium]
MRAEQGRTAGALAALALVIAAAPLAAQQARLYRDGGEQVRELRGSIPLHAPVRLEVVAQLGTITLRGVSGAALGYRLRVEAPASPGAIAYLDAWPVRISRLDRTVTVLIGTPAGAADPAPRGEFQRRELQRGQLTLELTVPRMVVRLAASTAVGNIRADQLAMPIWIATRAGDINAGTVAGTLQAQSGSGDIVIEHADAVEAHAAGAIRLGRADGAVLLGTSGGEVSVRSAGAGVRITSDGGGIDIGQAAGPVVAYSQGGNIRLGEALARAELHTLGGNILVESAHQLQCATRSGDIRLLRLQDGVEAQTRSGRIEAVFAPHAQLAASELVSEGGAVTVTLPPSVGAEVRAQIRSSAGHQIVGDYPALLATVASTALNPGWVQARAPLNGGGPNLWLLSVGADITIHKP